MEAGKRAAEARGRMNKARARLLSLSPEHATMLGVTDLELRAPSMRVSSLAYNAVGWDTLAITMSAMVWIPAASEIPAEQLWPTPDDVGAVAADNHPAVNWLYTQALEFLRAGREAAPKI